MFGRTHPTEYFEKYHFFLILWGILFVAFKKIPDLVSDILNIVYFNFWFIIKKERHFSYHFKQYLLNVICYNITVIFALFSIFSRFINLKKSVVMMKH